MFVVFSSFSYLAPRSTDDSGDSLIGDPATGGNCLVLWSERLDELPEFSRAVTVRGPADALPAQASILDLATGRELRQVQATEDGDQRRLAGIPLNPAGIMVLDRALRAQAD